MPLRPRIDRSEAFRIFDSGGPAEARRFRVEIPADCAYFRGHFPGHPVLPAIAQLALLDELIRRVCHPSARIRAIDVLRLRRPVRPGQTVEVELSPGAGGAPVQFEIRSGSDSITQGSVRWESVTEP